MSISQRQHILANLFPAAHAAVEPWDRFPWHLDANGVCDSWKPHSSQALAIDVFGTLATLPQEERDAALNDVAERLREPTGGPWTVRLEWQDPLNELNEKRLTQVDVVAEGAQSVIFFEVKFTERQAGCCSQVQPLESGEHRGLAQCNGNYAWQVNPLNVVRSRCALTGKGIGYWEHLHALTGLPEDAELRPCPFRGQRYQLMRNLVLCDRLAERLDRLPALVVTYVNELVFPVWQIVADSAWAWSATQRVNRIACHALSIRHVCDAVAAHTAIGPALRDWVDAKVARVVRR